MVIRVLLADQSATIQKLAAQAFAQEKIEVIRVGNGDLATWLLDEINPDMVIADVSLPDKNGYELCHFIKDNPRLSHIPVLLLCWSDETFDHDKANSARADAVLTKPFESRTLVENVRRLLQESGERQSLSASTHAPAHSEDSLTESVGPLNMASLVEEASFDSPSQAIDAEAEIIPATEEPPFASHSLLDDRDMLDTEAIEEAPLRAAAPTIVKEPEAVSYSAPGEQVSATASADPRLSSQRAGKGPLVWAVLAIIAFSAILGIWQAARIRNTQSKLSTNGNGSQVAQQSDNQQSADQQSADQQSQAGPASNSDAQPESLPELPQGESSERAALDPIEGPDEDPAQSFRNAARRSNPRASWPEMKITPFANTYKEGGANNFNGANNNRSADSKARILPQAKPSEPNRDATSPPKNNNSEQSPVRIIQGNAASAVTSGKANADAAAKPVVNQPNGFEQIGNSVKSAVAWTGKKAGRGIKAIARGLKRAFKHEPRID
jgi:DNA-binding response OmpR family regulator